MGAWITEGSRVNTQHRRSFGSNASKKFVPHCKPFAIYPLCMFMITRVGNLPGGVDSRRFESECTV
jgi:hypothetical protein